MEWVCFGPAIYNNVIPVYTNVNKVPEYLSNVTLDPSTENYYWCCRILAAMADPHFNLCITDVERFQSETSAVSHELINLYDEKMTSSGKYDLCEQANEEICGKFKESMSDVLGKVILTASKEMKDTYHR